MKDLQLSEIELEKRINSFLTRKFANTGIQRSDRTMRHARSEKKLNISTSSWRQYAV